MYRPDVVYNAVTGQYVLWWNYVSQKNSQSYYAAAVSPYPEGPFVVVRKKVNLTRSKTNVTGAGDGHLFVDPADGRGYFIYTAGMPANHTIGVDALTSDYLGTTGVNSPSFPESFVESPVLFERQGVYYAMFGHCCCFCYQGSGVIVHTAKHPLGPWTAEASGDVACQRPPHLIREDPTPGQGCSFNNSNTTSVTRAQQNFVISIGNGQMLWVGDRWGQAPDGIKGHEPTYMAPMVFLEDGAVAKMAWVDSFTIDVT